MCEDSVKQCEGRVCEDSVKEECVKIVQRKSV